MGYVFKLLVSALLIVGLIHFLDVGAALHQLATVDPAYALGGMAFYALVHAINAVKLRVVLPDQRVPRLLAFILVAQAYSLILPGQLAGEAVKAYRLARDAPGRASRTVGSVAFDKMTSLMALLLTTFGGLTVEIHRFGGQPFVAVAVGFTVLATITGLLSLDHARQTMLRLFSGDGWRGWVGQHLGHFLDAWRRHAAQPGNIAKSLLLGIAAQAAQAAAGSLLCRGLGLDVSFALWCVVTGALTLVLLAPFTIGGLGLREASLVGMLGLFGVGHDPALAVALAILGFQLLVTFVGLAIDLLVLRGPGQPAPEAENRGARPGPPALTTPTPGSR